MTVVAALEDVTVLRASREVLSSVSLEVRLGEVLALEGHPGAGKTTVMMTLAGAVEPHSGLRTCTVPVVFAVPRLRVDCPAGRVPEVPHDEGELLILADEPTFLRDRWHRRINIKRLHEFARRGHAVVVASHDDDVLAQADRLVSVDAGRLWELR